MDHRLARLCVLLASGGTKARRALAAQEAKKHDPMDALRLAGLSEIASRASKLKSQAEQMLEKAHRLGWRWVTPDDPLYPKLLKETSDPPIGLFVRGNLPPDKAPHVAIVGTRKPSPYGVRAAKTIASELARHGAVVVSGMARGIDTAAHQGCIQASGFTIAVWGTGPDRIYPPESGALAEKIAKSGLIITEFPPGTPPRKHNFPARNRIIAGICQAVVVVEGGPTSGALITARLALDEGRDVWAVPGEIFNETATGPNTLIWMGAKPLISPRHLLDDLGLKAESGPMPKTQSVKDTYKDPILRALAEMGPLDADEIARHCNVEISALLAKLLNLELEGKISRTLDGRYEIKR